MAKFNLSFLKKKVADGNEADLEYDSNVGDLILHRRGSNSTKRYRGYANNEAKFVVLSTAIQPDVTTTTEPVGTIAMTQHATGRGYLFYSDGTKWQHISVFVPA